MNIKKKIKKFARKHKGLTVAATTIGGAAIGSMIAPGIGTTIGAGIGAGAGMSLSGSGSKGKTHSASKFTPEQTEYIQSMLARYKEGEAGYSPLLQKILQPYDPAAVESEWRQTTLAPAQRQWQEELLPTLNAYGAAQGTGFWSSARMNLMGKSYGNLMSPVFAQLGQAQTQERLGYYDRLMKGAQFTPEYIMAQISGVPGMENVYEPGEDALDKLGQLTGIGANIGAGAAGIKYAMS